jgi:hypothetical protein
MARNGLLAADAALWWQNETRGERAVKNTILTGVLLGSVLLVAACSVQATKEPPAGVQASEALAKAVAQALVDRDFDAARKDFDKRMQGALSKAKLEEAWNQYGGNKGAFKEFGKIYVEYVNDSPCVFIPCTFENGGIVVQVTQDAQGTQVTGLFLRPPGFSFL